MSTADANVRRIAKDNECTGFPGSHRYTWRGGPDRVRHMALIDASSEFGQRAERRLRDEKLAWLTTVDSKGTPQPIPVWFLWDGADSILIYSKPDTAKL